MRASLSWPNHLQRSSPPNTITSGERMSTYESWGTTTRKSITGVHTSTSSFCSSSRATSTPRPWPQASRHHPLHISISTPKVGYFAEVWRFSWPVWGSNTGSSEGLCWLMYLISFKVDFIKFQGQGLQKLQLHPLLKAEETSSHCLRKSVIAFSFQDFPLKDTFIIADKPRTRLWEDICKNMYLIKDMCSKYAKNAWNLTIRKQVTQLKSGLKIWTPHQKRYTVGK